jgi:hypothetical protein
MYSLEKYRGSRSRYTCPSCGKKNQFAKYIDESGDYLDESVGRCNRESSCGYHLTPKEFFDLGGVQCSTVEQVNRRNKTNEMNALNKLNALNALNTIERIEHFDTIDNSFIVRSLEHTAQNRFINFLLSFIDFDLVQRAVKAYFVGTTKTGNTVFWQIDKDGKARTGKIISYSEQTGKRDKNINPSWIHYELKKAKLLPESFNQKTCFFGEHLLKREKRKPVGIVEAEKTAVIASIFLDKFTWVACGGKSYLKAEKLRRFQGQKIILYPDSDGFELWTKEAAEANKIGLDVEVSRIIEDTATEDERKSGFDLADYLIREAMQTSDYNRFVDDYNAKVDAILADETLTERFNELFDERLAITETELLNPEQIRLIVDYVV